MKTVQGSQARKIHKSLPTFWELICWINKEKCGQCKQACAIQKHTQSTFHSREPQKYLRNRRELFHLFLLLSCNNEAGWLFQTGHQSAHQSQQFKPELTITFLQKFQKTFKGGNLAITVIQYLFMEFESVAFSQITLFNPIILKGKTFEHQPFDEAVSHHQCFCAWHILP